ncbi:hypothetical protein VTJ04DRAFT_8593 [Mycothermus thermophilus]|uniref:uncharacterized protein n=1 Tax=Humicola insolens TaxID=85995 RepID=UPI003742E307
MGNGEGHGNATGDDRIHPPGPQASPGVCVKGRPASAVAAAPALHSRPPCTQNHSTSPIGSTLHIMCCSASSGLGRGQPVNQFRCAILFLFPPCVFSRVSSFFFLSTPPAFHSMAGWLGVGFQGSTPRAGSGRDFGAAALMPNAAPPGLAGLGGTTFWTGRDGDQKERPEKGSLSHSTHQPDAMDGSEDVTFPFHMPQHGKKGRGDADRLHDNYHDHDKNFDVIERPPISFPCADSKSILHPFHCATALPRLTGILSATGLASSLLTVPHPQRPAVPASCRVAWRWLALPSRFGRTPTSDSPTTSPAWAWTGSYPTGPDRTVGVRTTDGKDRLGC